MGRVCDLWVCAGGMWRLSRASLPAGEQRSDLARCDLTLVGPHRTKDESVLCTVVRGVSAV